MLIDLKDKCRKRTVTRDDGEIIRILLEENWSKTDRFFVDFNNVEVASVSFIDEAFGKLAFKYSSEELRSKLELRNILDYDKRLLNDILSSRYRQKSKEQNGLSNHN